MMWSRCYPFHQSSSFVSCSPILEQNLLHTLCLCEVHLCDDALIYWGCVMGWEIDLKKELYTFYWSIYYGVTESCIDYWKYRD